MAQGPQQRPGPLDPRLHPLDLLAPDLSLGAMIDFLHGVADALRERCPAPESMATASEAATELRSLVGRLGMSPETVTVRVTDLVSCVIGRINRVLRTAMTGGDMGEEGLRELCRVARKEASAALEDLGSGGLGQGLGPRA